MTGSILGVALRLLVLMEERGTEGRHYIRGLHMGTGKFRNFRAAPFLDDSLVLYGWFMDNFARELGAVRCYCWFGNSIRQNHIGVIASEK